MNKNMFKMFLLTSLVLFMSLSLVSASDMVNDTNDVVSLSHDSDVNNIKSVDKTVLESDKLSDNEVNYYVSDSGGSDNNTGTTSSSPFKTIQTALNKTTSSGTYNIYIGAGTYKGVGNTNLTVNGSHIINIIGDGINKTVLDGGVNYTISGSGTVWGNDYYWNAYTVHSGNWGLNITSGNGNITFKNFNIQNMVSVGINGGDDISKYPTATVDNYGNLIVENVYFHNNLAGVGAGIRNNVNATLTVNNSIFEGNRKSISFGNFGAGIYNNGTCIIENTLFSDNAARWGTVTNDYLLNVTNTTFKNGISYDLSSTYKFGSAIATNTGQAVYGHTYDIDTIETNIINSTFINNGQTDIYQDEGNLVVDNCKFINSTGIYTTRTTNTSIYHTIKNSEFTNLTSSTLFGSLSSKSTTTFGIYDQSSNLTIENNTIIFDGEGYAIRTYNNAIIKNNILTNKISITGTNNQVTNNTINAPSEYAVELNGKNNTVANNILTSYIFSGNKAVNSSYTSNVVENNTPESGQLINLTNDNYQTYFDENGLIKTENVENGSIMTIVSDLYDKNLTFDNTRILIKNPSSYRLYNSSILLKDKAYIVLENIYINNTNTNDYALRIQSQYTSIMGLTITVNTTSNISSVIFESDDVKISRATIRTYGVSSNEYNTIGLLINSNNNSIQGNIYTYANINQENGEIIGVYLNNSDNNELTGTIYAYDSINTIGLKINNSENNKVSLTELTTNATNNSTSMEVINSENNELGVTTLKTSALINYGIIEDNGKNNDLLIHQRLYANGTNSTGVLSSNSINTTIHTSYDTSFYAINGSNINGVKVSNNTGTNLTYLRFENTGLKTTDTNITSIYIENSVNTIISQILMNNQTKIQTGQLLILNNTNNTVLKSNTHGSFQLTPVILENSHNNSIQNLRLTTTNTNEIIKLINSNNNTITQNYLNYNNILGGDQTVTLTNSINNIIENNTPSIINLTDANYENYFTNNILNPEILQINLASDLYNKNMIFTDGIRIINPNNYTMYNCTITGNYESVQTIYLNHIFMNSTNNQITLINSTAPISINNNSIIYHENKEDIVQTIKINYTYNARTTISNSQITSIGNEKENKTTVAVIVPESGHIENINVTLKSNNNSTGLLIGILRNESELILFEYITNSNIYVSGNNVIGIFGNYYVTQNNIIIDGKNSTGIKINSITADINRNNIIINSDNCIGIDYRTDKTNNTLVNTQIYQNTLTLNSKNSTAMIIDYHTNGPISIDFNNIISKDTINIIISNITNSLTMRNNDGTAKETQLNIINTTNFIITGNNITNNQTQPIILINSTNGNITSNYLSSTTLKGNRAITNINSTNITISLNKPTNSVITNSNYNEFFKDGLFINEIDDVVEIGEDLYNKTMIFNKSVIIENPNNYTLYNSTINITENSTTTINNINIINTDSNILTSIESKGLLNLANSTIYQENNNASVNVIHINSTNINLNSILYNNITLNGNGTIIKVETARTSTRYNNISGDGDNITAINIENRTLLPMTQVSYNNITLKSDNPTTAIRYTNIRGVQTTYNKIIIKTNNNGTPIINITSGLTANMVNNNYLESYDSYGVSTIVKTGTVTINANNGPSGTFNTTINITTPKEMYINETITININTTDMLDRPINSGVLEVTYNNQTSSITINDSTATYTFTPTNAGENNIIFTFTPTNTTYLATNKTVNIQVNKYNTTINTSNVSGKINKTTVIPSQVIDELLNNVTGGNITVSDENGTILANSTVINGTSNLNLKFNTTGNKTLVITYTGTDKYEESTINITTTITKLNTTVTVDNVVGVVGESIILVARIVDEQGDNVTNGRVLFKINGVTLRDANGSVIYVNVTRGVARLTLTAVRGWTNTGAYISANYAGNSVYLTSASKNSTVNIAKRNATVEIVNDTRVYKAGDTITITAIVTDSNGQLAMSGQVVFKLNGVTLKDKNGKTIMVNVVNGIATLTYTLPSTFADYNYTITAIFAGGDYNRQVSKNSTLQVVKTSIHMDLDPVITTTNTAVIKAKIYDGNNKQITGTTRVTIKLNGVTIINSQNITNGNLQFTINTPYPTGLYNMTIVAGPNSVYEQLQRNTTLVIMKN